MAKVVVYHDYYGCDTGCCGHTIEMGDKSKFLFDHPYCKDFREWAEEIVASTFGAEHVADLDWENCVIFDD